MSAFSFLALACGPASEIEVDEGQMDDRVEDDVLFECAGGDRIPKFWICDGWPDCSSGLDEFTVCDEQPLFRCGDGQLVEWGTLCKSDGTGCKDNTDNEAFCHQFDDLYFACVISEGPGDPTVNPRIPFAWVCDGDADCISENYTAIDEEEFGCSYDRRPCGDGGTYRSVELCDGVLDCQDGTDEPEGWCEWGWPYGGEKPLIPD